MFIKSELDNLNRRLRAINEASSFQMPSFEIDVNSGDEGIHTSPGGEHHLSSIKNFVDSKLKPMVKFLFKQSKGSESQEYKKSVSRIYYSKPRGKLSYLRQRLFELANFSFSRFNKGISASLTKPRRYTANLRHLIFFEVTSSGRLRRNFSKVQERLITDTNGRFGVGKLCLASQLPPKNKLQ
jgi:hypothetical protein